MRGAPVLPPFAPGMGQEGGSLPLFSPGQIRLGVRGLFAALFIAGALHPPARAQEPVGAGLMVVPTRVVFADGQRNASVRLINNGAEAATFRLSLVYQRMTEDGRLEPVAAPGPGEQDAGQLLLFAPKVVRLAPGSQQTVRIVVRRPPDLAAGEYRSHLLIQAVPPAPAPASLEGLLGAGGRGGHTTVRLIPVLGVAVPVIVRHGPTTASVTLSGLALDLPAAPGEPPVLTAVLRRSGNQSVYGDLTASFLRNGAARVVGSVKGVAAYTPNAWRRVRVPLALPPGLELRGGQLVLTYSRPAEDGGGILAQARLDLP